MAMVEKNTASRRIADGIIYLVLFLLMLVMLLPFINVIASSFATNSEIINSTFLLWPSKISFDAYRYIFTYSNSTVRALGVSGGITACGTLINMLLTTLTAYALSYRALYGRRYLLLAVTFTMLFNPGIIANYFAIRNYHLIDNYLALILPRAISPFYLLLMKNFFQEIPDELKEASSIDGNSALGTFIRIILPLSKPAIATFALFYAVDHWNAYFDAILYMNTPSKFPITVILRQLVLMAQSSASEDVVISPVTMRMATIVASVAPILAIYPFLQRYFQSGLLVGSIKG